MTDYSDSDMEECKDDTSENGSDDSDDSDDSDRPALEGNNNVGDKKKKKSKKTFKFDDDIDEDDSDGTLCESCNKYYGESGYAHKLNFNLDIAGVTICIHCYISLSGNKFVECTDLTQNEEACLRFYIETFTDSHKSEGCQRIKSYGKCLLCEAKIGLKPPMFKENIVPQDNKLNQIELDKDVILVNKDEPSDYVLIL